MEATREDMNILDKICPPRLEDAGLEDCALPADAIEEAFLKAATAVGSRAASVFTAEVEDESVSGRDCINNSWPGDKSPQSDALVGVSLEQIETPGSCEGKKGRVVVGEGQVGEDLVSGERNEEDVIKKDEVVVVGGNDDVNAGVCVDGLKGLKIGVKTGDQGAGSSDEKKPTLVEGYF